MNWKIALKYLPLPLLVAAYPILFLFGHNAATLPLESLLFPLGASLMVASLAYAFFYLFQRKALTASLSAVGFMVFYYLYGSVYHRLASWYRYPIYQGILLPLVICLAALLAYFIARLKPSISMVLQKVLTIVSLALVAYNLLGVTVPVEAQKILASSPPALPARAATGATLRKPDIYYIIFDEYAGFDASRSYFHDSSVDAFEAFLQQNHFYVATGSRSPTLNTAAEVASRLNLQPYAENLPTQVKAQAIVHNKVMQVLKSYGYTTVVMDMAFQGISADINLQYDPAEVGGMAADEFQKTFIDTTMFDAFSGYLERGSQLEIKQRDLILYSLDKTASLSNVKTPKFVYTHVLLPHEPFIFDKDGNLLPPAASDDWNYYLGQHQYSTKLAEQLITRLLGQADPKNPPVIIVQSDHGARNLVTLAPDGTILNNLLQNYPPEDMHDILNALYLPGIDASQLSNSMDPTGTFAIVLNHYLNAGVTVNPTPAK